MEGAATTVYAQGGRGNARLVAWEGERTVTFTMEDALISPEGFMILSGAGLIEGSSNKPIYQHITETVDGSKITRGTGSLAIRLSKKPYLPVATETTIGIEGNYAYVMLVKNGEIISEPYIPVHEDLTEMTDETTGEVYYLLNVTNHENYSTLEIDADTDLQYAIDEVIDTVGSFDSAIVDYYVQHTSDNAMQIEITADKFGGNYYLEASTLFRDQNGVDMPAEFIIPNCKVQSNFTFTMASSGDPSTFTFTMDAFPDYTRFNKSKKVLSVIQIITDEEGEDGSVRTRTDDSYVPSNSEPSDPENGEDTEE